MQSVRYALAAFAFGALFAQTATADSILFNPQGTGATGAVLVGSFDWLPGNALAKGGNPILPAPGTAFTTYTHASLSLMLDPDSRPIYLPDGIEITFVAGFGEIGLQAGPGVASFAPDLSNPTNFLEIWWSDSRDSNMIEGTGFNNGPKRILLGRITNLIGSFFASDPIQSLDKFVVDDYPGQLTVTGAGGTALSVDVINYDPGFFPGNLNALKAFFNTSNVVPFNQTNPSRRFVDAPSAGDLVPGPEPAVTPSLGQINGGPVPEFGGPDFLLQSDANMSFVPGEVIPGTCRVTGGGVDTNLGIVLGTEASAKGVKGIRIKGNLLFNTYTFGGQVGSPTVIGAGGPFGEWTHHQKDGPAGDFVFHAGTRSAPKETRITAVNCQDPGACRPAEANANFKQINFEGTGSFRNVTSGPLQGNVCVDSDQNCTQRYSFKVDIDDLGEPGAGGHQNPPTEDCLKFLAADDLDKASDPIFPADLCRTCPDVYQIRICKHSTLPCTKQNAIYEERGFLDGGNLQIHPQIR